MSNRDVVALAVNVQFVPAFTHIFFPVAFVDILRTSSHTVVSFRFLGTGSGCPEHYALLSDLCELVAHICMFESTGASQNTMKFDIVKLRTQRTGYD